MIIIDKWENPKSGNNIVYNILDSLLELTLMRERKIMVNGELIEAPEICLVLDDLFTDDTIKKDEVWSDIYKRAHRCGLTTLTGRPHTSRLAKNHPCRCTHFCSWKYWRWLLIRFITTSSPVLTD